MAGKQTLADLIEALGPEFVAAFLESIASIKSDAQIGLIVQAIADRDADEALRLLNMEEGYFRSLDDAIRNAYTAGAVFGVDDVVSQAKAAGVRVSHQFNSMNVRARDNVAALSSQLVKEITEEQRASLRVVLREAFEQERSPRSVALEIVGRVNRQTRKREGGIIGLLQSEKDMRNTAFAELTSGDPKALANYLDRKTRDKRYDKMVTRAIFAKKPISANDARKILTGMENNLLRNRGERIARTELLGAVHAGKHEGLEQMVDKGEIDRSAIVNIWDSSSDRDTRDTHRAADGQERGQGETFNVGGYSMRYPGDRSLGAPAKEIINCRCFLRQRIDFISKLGR
jgi:hypothetical protein